LLRLSKKIAKIHEQTSDYTQLSQKRMGNLTASLNWACMEYQQTEERIGYAMGFLKLEDLRDFYEPSSFHKYNGIKDEMKNLKFD
jgi:hypothetical protein